MAKKTDSPINFLPEDYLARKRQQRTNIICLSLFAVVIAGLVAAFMMDERGQRALADQRETVGERTAAVGRQLGQIQQMQDRKEKMVRKANVTASLLERRPRSYIVARITNALPPGASLLCVELSTRQVKEKSTATASKSARPSRAAAKPGEKKEPDVVQVIETLRVTGLAPDDKVVSRFIAGLSDEPLFKEVDLIFSEEYAYNKEPTRRFMVQMDLNPQVEVTAEMAKEQRLRGGAME